jgi:hypothetical protein
MKHEERRCEAALQRLCFNVSGKSSKVDLVEVHPSSSVSCRQKLGLRTQQPVFDKIGGWDALKVRDRKMLRDFRRDVKPRTLILFRKCRFYSVVMNLNWAKMHPDTIKRLEVMAETMWNLSLEMAEDQPSDGNFFAIGQPAFARFWELSQSSAPGSPSISGPHHFRPVFVWLASVRNGGAFSNEKAPEF